jgi:hypothetical protein
LKIFLRGKSGTDKLGGFNTLSQSLTAAQFIERFRRNYINYAALVEVAFAYGDEMFEEYGRLTQEDQRAIIEEAKKYAARA